MADQQPQQPDPPSDPTLDPALTPSLQQSVNGLQNMQGLQGMANVSPETMEKLQAFLQQPKVKKYAALVSNPEFTADLMNLVQHPGLKQFGQWELGWLVLMVVLRSWWMSKTTHWFKALLTSFCTFVIYWIVAALALPSYFLNPEFMKLLKDAFQLLS